ncbi:helix-turn-helix domain-containing protein [Fusobacterium sp.]|uniref:helix-turn-helix domain-containing protein n=1 Tax=Fusobacterium sp. TaxID=68766 RepID=UPI001D548202|nr:helix-turn-helix domain-containing protein [Fusobacterium sp.]MBS5790537.1 helix-turn-helix domain-containing protein [Fusobacterium sp.]
MKHIGEFLKEQRLAKKLTLKQVQLKTNIPDSTLSRIEQGKYIEPSAKILKKLSTLYEIDVIYLYLFCGYLQKDDLKKYQQYFLGIDKLNLEEKNHIQQLINLFLKKKRGENNAI